MCIALLRLIHIFILVSHSPGNAIQSAFCYKSKLDYSQIRRSSDTFDTSVLQ